MTNQTRLIQHEDLPLFTGIPDEAPADLEITDRDRWLLVAQQLVDEHGHRLQLQRDVREWMAIAEGLRAEIASITQQAVELEDRMQREVQGWRQAYWHTMDDLKTMTGQRDTWHDIAETAGGMVRRLAAANNRLKRACLRWWQEVGAAYNSIDAITILDVRTPAEIAESIGAPISGVLQGHMTGDDWAAIKAAAGVGEGNDGAH